MIRKTLKLTVALLMAQAALLQAREMYILNWHEIAYSSNSSGRIVKQKYTTKKIIQDVAQNDGIDPRMLVYVFVPGSSDTEVVWKDTGETVETIYRFDSNSSAANADDSEGATEASVYDYASGADVGSAFYFDLSRYRNGVLKKRRIRGSFQLALPGYDTQNEFPYTGEDAVIQGTFSTRKALNTGS